MMWLALLTSHRQTGRCTACVPWEQNVDDQVLIPVFLCILETCWGPQCWLYWGVVHGVLGFIKLTS